METRRLIIFFLTFLTIPNYGQDTLFHGPKIIYADSANYWGIFRKHNLEQINLCDSQTIFEFANYYKGNRYVESELSELYILTDTSITIKSIRNIEIWNYFRISDSLFQIKQGNIVGYSKGLVPLNKTGIFSIFNQDSTIVNELSYLDNNFIRLLPCKILTEGHICNSDSVDQIAMYPGGLDSLNIDLKKYINSHIPILNNPVGGKNFLKVVIDESGNLQITKVLFSLGAFEEEISVYALLSLKKFEPAIKNKMAVPVSIIIPVEFSYD